MSNVGSEAGRAAQPQNEESPSAELWVGTKSLGITTTIKVSTKF